jgi:prepilin-type N-terminal cleavage/methylation domain-containing protein
MDDGRWTRDDRIQNGGCSAILIMTAKTRKNRGHKGFTLVEVLMASMLLTAAMVPILKGLTSAHILDVKIERRMRSLTLAEAERF